jgi:hypothetical protein
VAQHEKNFTGCSKIPSSKAAADGSTGGVASVGYVEDAFEVRTLLAGFFSILLIAWWFEVA